MQTDGPLAAARRLDVLPTVSVVIPARNEARNLAPCLEAVLGQDYPADRVEILVVDGGSDDASRAVVESYRARDPRIRLLDNPVGSIPAGLNVGVRASRGDVIARVDARTLLDPAYLSTGVRLLHETNAANVGGPVRSVSPEYLARVLSVATESRFGMGGAAVRYGEGEAREVDTVYLGLYSRTVLQAIGLYDEELVRDQDDELNYRLRARGGRILMSPAMRARYLNSPSVRRFARQNFLYGYWKVRVCQKHPMMANWRHLVPPAFVLGLLVGPALVAAGWVPGAFVAGPVGGYAAAAVAAATTQGRRAGWRYAPALPAIFALLHVSWGLGFLAGVVRFVPRWFAPEPPPPILEPAVGEVAPR